MHAIEGAPPIQPHILQHYALARLALHGTAAVAHEEAGYPATGLARVDVSERDVGDGDA